ncbi:ankyrin repeat domain-containing protein SOWAHD [Hemiscyllium ocellatum]|uniref:ankyrin repeat domain-containing protein SOWAHD n=1 Tax=Hemiscyllium ocellatum TaxID=170820 RepID=UPI00296646C2|nr:ankyrin repeat domain-containing protein SOWAHD [Hemiscyllium ocellatum]
MFEKLGELTHSRFLGEASPPQEKPSPPASACSGSREGLSYSAVLEDVNRLSRLLGRFLKTAESAGVKPAESFPLRRRAEAGRGSLRKRESFRSEAGARRKGLRELMLRDGWGGLGGMWSAHSGGRREQQEEEEEQAERAPLSSPGSPGEALESREHEWALALAAGDWEVMEALLLQEPALLNHREFVSGLTAAHWLAKRGDHHGLTKLARLAQSRGWSLDLNARAAGGGYTALHLAAMQGHPMVIKLLVGAYDADVDIRDYRGRKAWQYLAGETPAPLRQLAGAQEQEEPQPPRQAPAPHRQHDSPTKNREFSLIPSVHRLLKLSSWQREKPEKADSR